MHRVWVVLAVVAMLSVHTTLAVWSLVQENPTIDEVIHLPAGLTYWQKGTFRLYHHNPPLVKLVAALPLLNANLAVDYTRDSWKEPPNKAAFAHEFMENNAKVYFELFTRARVWMPLFSIIGGLVVFFWSRALYGNLGGLLSLALWVLCPNVLAHTRLVTTDMGATSLGVLATFVFWLYLKRPSWWLAVFAGVCLGLAQLTKFSLLILYGLLPVLVVLKLILEPSARRMLLRLVAQLVLMVVLSVLVIDVGYGFEGVGLPLGDFEFTCQTLTVPVPPGMARPHSPDDLLDGAWQYRVNRFRRTPLASLPVPFPKHYLLGFDAQKLEAEGIPRKFLRKGPPGPDGDVIDGYPVYLDGTLSQTSWWYYYLLTLVYKVPEGTWLLVVGSLVVMALSPSSRASAFDETAVLIVPVLVLFVMSTLTNINLGLRYVLPIFPYVFISAGKLAPWSLGLTRWGPRIAASVGIVAALSATAAATFSIHPHYLAYFNLVSGGPSRGSRHLIDSNIDWGQDLVNLRKWLDRNAPGERIGLAYFGQINPRIFEARGEGFEWFLPPPRPGTMQAADLPPRYMVKPESMRLEPGLYAVSASLVRGLPWRVYDSPWKSWGKVRWVPFSAWKYAFDYFGELTPVDQIGHSIYIYRVTPEDARRLAHYWDNAARPR
jgi:hypothetical protein